MGWVLILRSNLLLTAFRSPAVHRLRYANTADIPAQILKIPFLQQELRNLGQLQQDGAGALVKEIENQDRQAEFG